MSDISACLLAGRERTYIHPQDIQEAEEETSVFHARDSCAYIDNGKSS